MTKLHVHVKGGYIGTMTNESEIKEFMRKQTCYTKDCELVKDNGDRVISINLYGYNKMK